jgi:acetyl esterase/lipase
MKNPIYFVPVILLIVFPLIGSTQILEKEATYILKKDIFYRESGETDNYMKERCRLDLYYPTDKKDFSTIVWFHGGGLRAGEKFIPDVLKNQGFAVVAVNYRLYPKVKCPEYIEDAAAAVAWVFKHIEEYGGDISKIVVSGHSAGGYLTSMVGLDKSYLSAYGIEADSIAALVPFSGHAVTHFTVREEQGIGGTEIIVDKYAPIAHIRKEAPPMMLITGDREKEMLGRYEENAYLYRMMLVIGHENTTLYELDGFNHVDMAEPAFYLLSDYVRNMD